MSHLIKIYTVCKFSYFRLWYLKELTYKLSRKALEAFVLVPWMSCQCPVSEFTMELPFSAI